MKMHHKVKKQIEINLSLQSRDHSLDLFEGEASIAVIVDLVEEMLQLLLRAQWCHHLESHHQLSERDGDFPYYEWKRTLISPEAQRSSAVNVKGVEHLGRIAQVCTETHYSCDGFRAYTISYLATATIEYMAINFSLLIFPSGHSVMNSSYQACIIT